MSTHQIPYPSDFDVNYHEAAQEERVRRARAMIDPGDVISVVESRLSQEGDVTKHPLYQLTLFFLDRTHACDGGKLFDDWKVQILAAIDTCLDDALEVMEG